MALSKVFNSGICLFETRQKDVGLSISQLHNWAKNKQIFQPNYLSLVSHESSLFPQMSFFQNLELYGFEKEIMENRLSQEYPELSPLIKKGHVAISKLTVNERFLFSLLASMLQKSELIVIKFNIDDFNQINLIFLSSILEKYSSAHSFIIVGVDLKYFESISEYQFNGSDLLAVNKVSSKILRIA